jgi:hypothetical protein
MREEGLKRVSWLFTPLLSGYESYCLSETFTTALARLGGHTFFSALSLPLGSFFHGTVNLIAANNGWNQAWNFVFPVTSFNYGQFFQSIYDRLPSLFSLKAALSSNRQITGPTPLYKVGKSKMGFFARIRYQALNQMFAGQNTMYAYVFPGPFMGLPKTNYRPIPSKPLRDAFSSVSMPKRYALEPTQHCHSVLASFEALFVPVQNSFGNHQVCFERRVIGIKLPYDAKECQRACRSFKGVLLKFKSQIQMHPNSMSYMALGSLPHNVITQDDGSKIYQAKLNASHINQWWDHYIIHLTGQKRKEAMQFKDQIFLYALSTRDTEDLFQELRELGLLKTKFFLKTDEAVKRGAKPRALRAFSKFMTHFCGLFTYTWTAVFKANFPIFTSPFAHSASPLPLRRYEETPCIENYCFTLSVNAKQLSHLITHMAIESYVNKHGQIPKNDQEFLDELLNILFLIEDAVDADASCNSIYYDLTRWIQRRFAGSHALVERIDASTVKKLITRTRYGHKIVEKERNPTGSWRTTFNNTTSIMAKVNEAMNVVWKPNETTKFLSDTGDDFIGTFKEIYDLVPEQIPRFISECAKLGMKVKARVANCASCEYLGAVFLPALNVFLSLVLVPQPLRWPKIGTFHSLDLRSRVNQRIAATGLYWWELVTRINPLVNAWVRHAIRSLNAEPYQNFSFFAENPTFSWFDLDSMVWFSQLKPVPEVWKFYESRYNLSQLQIKHFIDCLDYLPSGPAVVSHPVLQRVWATDLA